MVLIKMILCFGRDIHRNMAFSQVNAARLAIEYAVQKIRPIHSRDNIFRHA